MMRTFAILMISLVILAGCISTQTKAELAAAKEAVARLEVAVAKAQANNALDIESLRAQLNTAQTNLAKVEAKANAERKESGAGIAEGVQAGTTTFAPLLAGLFPGAGLILGILGTAAGAIKDSLRKA